MADITINCVDCKNDFVWSERDQEFYADHNYDKPKRCKSCRDKRKSNNNNSRNPRDGGFDRKENNLW